MKERDHIKDLLEQVQSAGREYHESIPGSRSRLLRLLARTRREIEGSAAYLWRVRMEVNYSRNSVNLKVDLMFPIGGNLVRQLRGPGGLSQFPDGPENVTPFRATYGPMSMFEYFEQDLEHKSAFDSYMAGRASWGRRQWFDIVDIEQGVMLGCRKDRDAVFAVHVGGGKGLDLTNFRNRYPDCPGRCVLQELPKTLESVQPVPESVELMPHDFFTAQPIQGACLNLLNAMLHDWSEGRCRKILHRTAQAMEPGYSRLFIQEMISKEMGESFRGAALDILMFMVPEEQSGHCLHTRNS
ncbi:MAG: hypothetical protein Q9162_007687 [Coniocarpon cinnabarinum]